MKVFISWSGLRSKKLANALHDWLPLVLQNVQPYMSSEDITTGTRWLGSISSELESSNFGVFCLTPENLTAPWIHFEAGALSKIVNNSHVIPLLFDLKPTDIKGPLDQFQAAVLEKEGVYRILRSVNHASGAGALGESHLERQFTALWPQLEEVIKNIEPDIRVIDVEITFSPKDPQGRTLTYPLKCYVKLENSSMGCIDVKLSEYIPKKVANKQALSDVLQVRFGGWCPSPDGVGRLAVLPGQLFRAWVGLDETKFTREQVENQRGEIGTLVFSINGDVLNVNI
jgi:hypothetical protein